MKRLVLPLVLFASLPAAAGQSDENAVKVLIKALGSQRDVRATLLQTRSDGEQTITVSVQIVPRRGVVARVTKPLLFAGMVSYDNGEVWKNYDPQLDVLRIEPSPAKFHFDTAFRKKLIEKNYTVKLEREALVAGRKTNVVVLKARVADVSSRRLYIDAVNSLILRYIVEESDGASVVTVDTQSVDLETPIDVASFENIGRGAAKVEKAWGPIEVARSSDARRYTGFTPEVPANLPAGLAMQALHVVGTAQRPFVGVRLTDGMAVVTVYLWQPKEGEARTSEPLKGAYDAKGADGTRVKVVGDGSDRVKGEIARLFARECGGPTAAQGTADRLRNVQDRQTTGGGAGLPRPRLVNDYEE